MSLRPVRMGSWPVSSGSCGSLNGRLVLQIVTDIDFIMRLKIVNRPIKHGVHTHVKVPRFGQQATTFSQNVQVRSPMRCVVAGHIHLHPARLQQHKASNEGNYLAAQHHQIYHDVSRVAEPDAVIFRWHGGQMTSAKVRTIFRKYQMPEATRKTTRLQDNRTTLEKLKL